MKRRPIEPKSDIRGGSRVFSPDHRVRSLAFALLVPGARYSILRSVVRPADGGYDGEDPADRKKQDGKRRPEKFADSQPPSFPDASIARTRFLWRRNLSPLFLQCVGKIDVGWSIDEPASRRPVPSGLLANGFGPDCSIHGEKRPSAMPPADDACKIRSRVVRGRRFLGAQRTARTIPLRPYAVTNCHSRHPRRFPHRVDQTNRRMTGLG